MKHTDGHYLRNPSPCLCLNIRRASRAVTEFYENILKPSGLKATQYSLLRYLNEVEPITITEFAKIMRIDRTTLNRNMKPLIGVGFIEVNPGDDPRSKQITLTKDGKSALSIASNLWDEAQESMQEYLGKTEIEQYKHLISKLEALVP